MIKNYDFLFFRQKYGASLLLSSELLILDKNLTKKGIIIITNFYVSIKEIDTKLEIFFSINSLFSITISKKSSEFFLHVKNKNNLRLSSFKKKTEIIETLIFSKTGKNDKISFPINYINNLNLQNLPEKSSSENNLTRLEFLNTQKNLIDQKKKKSKTSKTIYSPKKEKNKITILDFELLKVLGRGNYGKVLLCKKKDKKKLFAIKIIKKKK